jgi:hypothetical protein
MELILSAVVFTFLVLVAAFVDFLVNPWSQSVYHGDVFWAEPKRAPVAELASDSAAEYERAA